MDVAAAQRLTGGADRGRDEGGGRRSELVKKVN